MRIVLASLAIGVFVAGSTFAQYVISAHSGVVQTVEGRAYLNDQLVDPKFGQFPEIKENQVLRTEEGRAEILLTPGVFLRVGENSSIRMISNKLTDTRVEVLTGSAMVEFDNLLKSDSKDNAVTLLYKGASMLLVKHGLYRVDTDPARFQVYEGEAIVKSESGQATLKSGKQTALNGVLMAENFDKKAADDLYFWSNQRSGYLAKASASSAMSLHGAGGSYSLWQWNPMFGLFTFVPYSGIAYSPFGWGFWSPYSVLSYYPYYGGYYGGGRYVSRGTPSFGSGSRGLPSPSTLTFGGGRSFPGGFEGSGGASRGMAVGGGGGGMAGAGATGGGGGHAGGGGAGGGHGR